MPIQESEISTSDAGGQSAAMKQPERQRRLQSFLTWSFFLAQIAAGEMFIGSGAQAGPTDEPLTEAGDADDRNAGQPLSAPAVQATADALPANTAENAGQASKRSDPAAAEPAPAWGEPAEMPASGKADMFVVAGGSANAGQDVLTPAQIGVDALLSSDGGALDGPLHAGLTLDASVLLGEALGDAMDLVGGALTSLASVRAPDDLLEGLFHTSEGVAEQLIAFASLGETSAEVIPSGPGYTDLLLALADDGASPEPIIIATGGSLFLALPVFGDALISASAHAEVGEIPDPADTSVIASQISDHIGHAKGIGDLWG
jgi:hypothetical protein